MSKFIVNEGGAVHEVEDAEADRLVRGRDPINGKPNANLGMFREATSKEITAAKKAAKDGVPYLATDADADESPADPPAA